MSNESEIELSPEHINIELEIKSKLTSIKSPDDDRH